MSELPADYRLILCLWRNQAREQTSVDLSHSRETINQVCVCDPIIFFTTATKTQRVHCIWLKKNSVIVLMVILRLNLLSQEIPKVHLKDRLHLCVTFCTCVCLLIWPPQLYVKLNICAWERFVCDEWSVSPHKYLWDWCVRSFSRKNVSIKFRGMQKMTVASTIYDGYFHLSLVVSSYFVRLTKRSCTDET